MNHKLRTALGASLLAAVALLAACHSTSSTTAQTVTQQLRANPALYQQLTSVETQGVNRLKNCLPNGPALMNTVLSGQASVLNAVQLAQAFAGTNLQATLQRCHLQHAIHRFHLCFGPKVKAAVTSAISNAVHPYLAHPIADRHVIVAATSMATSQATVRTAAACFATLK